MLKPELLVLMCSFVQNIVVALCLTAAGVQAFKLSLLSNLRYVHETCEHGGGIPQESRPQLCEVNYMLRQLNISGSVAATEGCK